MPARLLLADDSVTIQRVIELTFADEQVEVVAVGDGRAAIERIQADPPDIVLADVGMPERDGYEVAAFMKTQPHLAHIPIVLLTGAFEPIDEARARAVGCDEVLVKPFEPQIVISRVRELLSGDRPVARVEPLPSPPAVPAPGETGRSSEREGPADPASAGGLDDYFNRLDAALAGLATTSRARRAAADPEPTPADDGEATHHPQPTQERTGSAHGPSAWPGAASPPLADAFAALLAAEQGQAHAPAAPAASIVSEGLIEDIVRRVIARMGDADMRRLVLDSAERLVREEIERIKAR